MSVCQVCSYLSQFLCFQYFARVWGEGGTIRAAGCATQASFAWVGMLLSPRMSRAAWRPKFENRYSKRILGSFGHYRLVSLALVGTHFIRKREILLARLLRKSSFSPPAEESCQYSNDDYRDGKRNEEP